MYSDVHVHTKFSSDSQVTVEEQITRAIKMGMKHVCITDHQDYDYPIWHSTYLLDETGDLDHYINKLKQVKEVFKNEIEVLLGIEFGLQPHLAERHNREYIEYPFDMVIGSTHCFNGKDTEDQTLYEGKSKDEAIMEYLSTELENLSLTNGYDTIGHLDYVLRDIPGKNAGVTYSKFADVIDAILHLAINRGKAIELNTKSLVIGMRDSSPGKEVFQRYYEMGGEMITLGSDAHFPERIGACFDIAGDILKDIGFKYYCIFRGHAPVYLPL